MFFEFRRQLAHIVFGICILWGVYFQVLTAPVLGGITFISFLALCGIKYGYYVPVLSPVLHMFERPEHLKKCPGRGFFFFLLGAFLSVLLFEERIVMAVLSILLIGDAVTNVAGRHLGVIKNPLNKDKTVEGTLAGIIVSWWVCSLFFPVFPSLIASVVAMIVEIPKLSIGKIPVDDNVTIPLSAGLVLYLFSL